MSKIEVNFVPADKEKPVPAGHVRKTYQYFDLETFENKTETVDIPFTAPKDLAEAQLRVGGNEETLLAALTSYLRTETLRTAENAVTAKGGKRSAVMAVAKPFRAFPPFNAIYKLDASGKPLVDSETGEKVIDRKAQTAKILEMIKRNPDMIETIRAGSQIESDNDENEDTE